MECTLARDTSGNWIYTQKFQPDELESLKQELLIMRQLCGSSMGRYWAIFYRAVYGHRPIVSSIAEEWTAALVKEGLVIEADNTQEAKEAIMGDLYRYAESRKEEEDALLAEAMEQFVENDNA